MQQHKKIQMRTYILYIVNIYVYAIKVHCSLFTILHYIENYMLHVESIFSKPIILYNMFYIHFLSRVCITRIQL